MALCTKNSSAVFKGNKEWQELLGTCSYLTKTLLAIGRSLMAQRNSFSTLHVLTYLILIFLPRLPLPWLIYSAANVGKAMVVNSTGLFCSVFLLFIMLIAVVIAIAVSKWRLSKLLGGAMFQLYVVFLVISLLLLKDVIKCPDI